MTQPAAQQQLDQQVINVLKGLVIDGVNQAKSGHPGGAMSSMDFAAVLFSEFLNFDPDDAQWIGRDRFILSAGHESMLLYALLHLNGWLPVDQLRRFRQLHSKTPGHPENTMTPGVECTTGPLGQGAAMSVGFATAASHFAATLDKDLFSHKTYVVLGDGCMQEDVTLGAASLAGHLRLRNLVWFYDRNRIQISGKIDRATSDDEAKIFAGFGWEVVEIDGHDHQAIRTQLTAAKKQTRPMLIIGNTTMAKGAATLEGTHKTHGEPLPADERLKTREKFGLPADQDFFVPASATTHFQRRHTSLRQQVKAWKDQLAKRIETDAPFRKLYHHCFVKEDLESLPALNFPADKPVATRNAFGEVLQAWATALPNLFGGSADLEPSNMTGAFAKVVGDFTAENPRGRNMAFGVREFPMSALTNGMALHGGIVPFDATFLTFSDYSRPALRLGAIQQVRVIHEFTHDSFYLGEDGPTHQPVEHIMSLRMIPDFYVMRPADARETATLMRKSLTLKAPSAICLSRQKLPILDLPEATSADAARGAYIVHDARDPEYLIIATGSEVSLALDTAKRLSGQRIRIVSMPCWELFAEQPKTYQDEVLPPHLTRRISIEAGVTLGWQKFTGSNGLNIGIDHFGASAPAEHLAIEYGFTPEAVAEKIMEHRF